MTAPNSASYICSRIRENSGFASETPEPNSHEFGYNSMHEMEGIMLRGIACATLALAVLASWAPAQDRDGKRTKGKMVLGKLVKCDPEKHMISVTIKKRDTGEDVPMEYSFEDDTPFVVNKARGEKSTVFRGKADLQKDEFKDRFKEGVLVGILLDGEGKTALRVITDGRRKSR
jgi:hypothetical protein